MTKIEVKDKIMLDGLNGKIEYPAEILSYVDLLWSLKGNTNIEVYCNDETVSLACEYVFGTKRLVTAENLLKIASNIPDNVVAYVTKEGSNNLGDFLYICSKRSYVKESNLLPILAVSDITPAPYNIVWTPRDITQAPIRFYMPFQMLTGEGWGDLEGKPEALTTKVTQELYDSWKSKINSIEEEKSKKLEEYILSQKNENKK